VDTLALINCDALQKRIARGNITMLRKGGWNNNALIKYDSLPQSWQDLLVRKFGEPKRMVTFE
jgi:hypothetical protein